MSQQALYVAVFLVVIACLPWLIKQLVARNSFGKGATGSETKIVSVVAVGPTQRVVTVEAGPEHDRLCLVLGVTSQQITCLHKSSMLTVASGRTMGPSALDFPAHEAPYV